VKLTEYRFEYASEVIEQMKQILDTDEQIIVLGDWCEILRVWYGASWQDQESWATLCVTQRNMYTFVFKNKLFGGKQIISNQVYPLELFVKWSFTKQKDNKGNLTGLRFKLQHDVNVSETVLFCEPIGAQAFKEKFEAVMLGFKSKEKGIDVAAQLAALNDLFSDGILTPDEFTRAKEIYLGKSPDAQILLDQSLRSLKQLRDVGALSDAEYEAKKWDVISN
jgi:hypothetical protein